MTAFDSLPPRVTIYEVGPRDGLQNEPQPVPTQAKIQFINLLAEAGLPYIEATSFVQAGAIPQLADAEEVVAGVGNGGGARFTALVPNVRGMERASSVRLFGIALFTAASETFSRRNVNASIAETLGRFRPVVEVAKSQGLWIRGYVSTAFGCPFEGHVPPPAVVEVALELLELGVEEISVSDTIVDEREPERRYMPGHPDADTNGYVAFPRINPAEDMVDLLDASRSYEANVAAMSAVKDMIQKSLDLFR